MSSHFEMAQRGTLNCAPNDVAIAGPVAIKATRKHSHYFKPCPFDEIDVYRVLELFSITDQAIGHAIKKLLVAGGRGGGKSIDKDIQEAIDTLERWKDMRAEEINARMFAEVANTQQ
jgi:hypothetical protein